MNVLKPFKVKTKLHSFELKIGERLIPVLLHPKGKATSTVGALQHRQCYIMTFDGDVYIIPFIVKEVAKQLYSCLGGEKASDKTINVWVEKLNHIDSLDYCQRAVFQEVFNYKKRNKIFEYHHSVWYCTQNPNGNRAVGHAKFGGRVLTD